MDELNKSNKDRELLRWWVLGSFILFAATFVGTFGMSDEIKNHSKQESQINSRLEILRTQIEGIDSRLESLEGYIRSKNNIN